MAALPAVRAPTLLIVGGLDGVVIDMNRSAAALLACEHRLEIVPGATHLFEEPGKLEEVARLARKWFQQHLGRAGRGAGRATAAPSQMRA
jgi:pimeloyl-ACP methyl ester carboxylesterase